MIFPTGEESCADCAKQLLKVIAVERGRGRGRVISP